jgi:F0F1-type ATP synthase assembly protein I
MPFHPPIPEKKDPAARPSGPFGTLVQAEKLMQIAFILPCAVFIGWLGGDWGARRVHQPWPIAVGVILGAAAGMVAVIRMAMQSMKDVPVEDEDSGPKEDTEDRR